MHNPREGHLQAAYRILRYLKTSPSKEVLFKRNNGMSIEVYTNANYAGSPVDKRSTSGYCTFLGGNLVTCSSKKQSVATTGAEFRAMALEICELLWIKIILDDLKSSGKNL